MAIRIGTAGWGIAAPYRSEFPAEGFGLERYSARFSSVEVNSSFYRSHRPSTWTRWADLVPEDFRFAVKVPRIVTHDKGLRDCAEAVARFLDEIAGLGKKLGVLLVQLPPRRAYDRQLVETFFGDLVSRTGARIACEPRHASWFEGEADRHLATLGVARVAADPARAEGADRPGGTSDFYYWRLHGSPAIYRSSYGAARLDVLAAQLRELADRQIWCIFDNTAAMAATGDALALAKRLTSINFGNQASCRDLVG